MDQHKDQRIDIGEQPGHYIRRLWQISVVIFLQEARAYGITPVQYAALQTIANSPSIDQRTLARLMAWTPPPLRVWWKGWRPGHC